MLHATLIKQIIISLFNKKIYIMNYDMHAALKHADNTFLVQI